MSIKAVRICLLAASARGVRFDPAALGIGPELADPLARVTHRLVARLWTELPERAGDPCFGLHTAEIIAGLAFDVVDYACISCATLRDALATMIRYARLVHDAYDIRLDETEGRARYSVRFDCDPPMPRHLIEMILAGWVLRVRRGIVGTAPIDEVWFPHAAPEDVREHARVLGVPCRWETDHGAVIFDRAMLDAPLVRSEPELNALLARQADAMLAERTAAETHAEPDLLGGVRRHVAETLPQGRATIDEVARRLGTSRRSLQRHLQELGSTFADIVDDTRRAIAQEQLKVKERTLCEIAFLTGFSDASAFTRAFRRWTGETPTAHRLRAR